MSQDLTAHGLDDVEDAATGADLPGDAFQTLLGPRADTAPHAARVSGSPSPQLPLSSPFSPSFSSQFSSQSDAAALSPAAARRRLTLIALGAAAFAVPATIAALVLLAPGLSPALLVTLALTGGSAVLVGLPVLAMVGRIGRRAASGPPVTSEPPDRRRPHSPVGTPRRTTAQRRPAAQAPRPPSGSAGSRGAVADRTVLLAAAEQALDRRDLIGGEVALLILEVAEPVAVAGALGPTAAADVARQTIRRLQAWLPGQDTVAQLGSGTFAVLTEGVGDAEAARGVAARLAALVTEPMSSGQRLTAVRFAIGVATSGGDLHGARELVQAALEARVQAMELAEQTPDRSTWSHYDPSRHSGATAMAAAEIELREALRARRIQVAFRPIVRLTPAPAPGGRTIAMEALPRWARADGSHMAAEQIESLAEAAGMSAELGVQVLGCGLDAVSAWYAAGFPVGRLAVRLSAGHLAEPDLVSTVTGQLSRRGLPASCLVVELDAAAASDAARVRPVLAGLRRHGVEVMITSVVVPSAGVALLHTLPASGISLHPSVTRAMTTHSVPVAAAAAACRRLGTKVLVEGVSRPEQLEAARRLGIHGASGPLLGLPAGPRDVTARFGLGGSTTYS